MTVSSNARGNAQPMPGAIHATNATDERNVRVQDFAKNRPVPDAAGAVDNPKFVRFIELDDAGWSGRQMAKELKVNERTITRWRAATGRAKREAPVTHPQSDRDRAAAMIADGAPFQEAAAAVGVSFHTIRHWFPDAKAWTKSQAGQYGQMSRRLTALGRVA